MITLFARFKSLRFLPNYLLIDLTIVEFMDVMVNIPIFIELFLLTEKIHLDRHTRWYAMLFHRFFLINDLITQISLSIDCLLAITFGKAFTGRKTSTKVLAFIALKWMTILVLLLVFSASEYPLETESVSEENYQKLLFGHNQIIWKVVIPSCQCVSVFTILLTNYQIMKTRIVTSKHYGMKLFGRGSKNSNKAINTLFIILVVQTLCKVPAEVYSYVGVDDKIEGNRWRALAQIRRHPFAKNAYLDYAAQHGLTHHRNGRVINLKPKRKKNTDRRRKRPEEDLKSAAAEETKETNFTAKSTSRLPNSLTEESFIGKSGDIMAVPSTSKDGRPKDTDNKSASVVTVGEKGLLNNQTSELENQHGQIPQSDREGISNERIKSEDGKDEDNVNRLSSSPITARTEEDEDGRESRENHDAEKRVVHTGDVSDDEQYSLTYLHVDVQIHRESSAAAEAETAPPEDVPTHRRDSVAVPDDVPTHRRDSVAVPDDVPTHRRDSVAVADDVPTHRRDSVAVPDDVPICRRDSVAVPDDVPTHRRDSVAVPDNVPTHRRDSVAVPDDVPICRRDSVAVPDDVPTHRRDSVAVPDNVPTHRSESIGVADDVPICRRDSVAVADDVPIHRRDSVAVPDNVPICRRDSVAVADDVPTHRSEAIGVPDDVPICRRDSVAAADDVPICRRDSVAVADDVPTHRRDSVAVADDVPICRRDSIPPTDEKVDNGHSNDEGCDTRL
ncbi:hypothetical protein QZH41_001546 [Actinostola sp. cb2023]|nr:hypothetical protein QZH41_001546 [Actinostola sp. cb2023]